MDEQVNRSIAYMGGAAALPRKNGELVFEAPWQARAFGMAVALANQRLYPWEAFRQHLIAEVAESTERAKESPAAAYYESWLASLEHVLMETGVCSEDELSRRVAEFASGAREEIY